MAEAQGEVEFEPRIDSPSRNNKSSKTDTPNSKEPSEETTSTSMHPPSSSSYNPYISIQHYMMSQYDSRSASSSQGPYDPPSRKRPHRSPSDSSIRASVLRDGSKPERESPLSLTYPRSNTPPHTEYSSRRTTSPSGSRFEVSGDNTANVTPSPGNAVPFDRPAAVESDTPADVWNSSSSCPEGMFSS